MGINDGPTKMTEKGVDYGKKKRWNGRAAS